MADIQDLARMLEEMDDQLVSCMKCGMCQGVCPVFAETHNEGDVTRGKIFLLEGLAAKMITDAQGVKERIDKCLMCGTCAANCPSGVNAMEIFLKARSILTGYLGLSPVKKAIFRGTLAHPARFTKLLEFGSKFQSLFSTKADAFMGTSCSAVMSPLIGKRHFVPMAKKPLHTLLEGAVDTPAGKSGVRVAFYTGCVVDKFYPNVGRASLKVLKHHGVGVFLPEDQGCCGIPALASGDTETFAKLLRYNVGMFQTGAFDYLVTPCATCTATVKELWPMMAKTLAPEKTGAVNRLAEKTMDLSAFLVNVVGVKGAEATGEGSEKITWHDPCHLGKSLGVFSEPRTLLTAGGNRELVEMNEANYCCGNGGSFNLQHYDTSSKIGMRKRDNVVETGATTVATGCPACMMQLTDMLSRKGDRIKVRHAIEVYADTID